VQGDGYVVNLGQIKFATLVITGDCLLFQKVIEVSRETHSGCASWPARKELNSALVFIFLCRSSLYGR